MPFYVSAAFTPLASSLGGLVMGLSVVVHLALAGRLTGLSSTIKHLVCLDRKDWRVTAVRIAGLVHGGLATGLREPAWISADSMGPQELSWVGFVAAGFLVGFGTRLGNGCTSGHGVCGLARVSPRSIASVASFMTAAVAAATAVGANDWLAVPRSEFDEAWTAVPIAFAAVSAVAAMVALGTSGGKDQLRILLSGYVAGLAFAAGLVVAGMGQRSKVVGFLNLSPSPAGWDPSLMLVLGGAVGLCFCGFRLIAHCMERPRLGRKFCLPPTDRIDLPLILGGWCFGLGWGVAGICPGPGLLLVASGYPKALLGFAPALAVGMHLAVAVKLRIKAANSKAADISASAPPSAALLFRQLIDKESSTYSYLLADPESRDAVLIDPVLEQQPRDEKLLRELGLRLRFVVNTHVHADHFSGSGLLKRLFADDGCQSVLGANAGEDTKADIKLGDGERIAFGRFGLTAASTPGHTDGCITLVLDDQTMAFTGDALLVRGCGRTDFQGGSAPKLYVSVRRAIFSLPDTCLLYPAHDYKGFTATTVGEEKALNPRLAEGIGLERFVVTMKELGLPRPKHMDKVLPANIQCGLQDLPGTWQTKVDSLPRPLPSGPNKTSPRMMPKQPQA